MITFDNDKVKETYQNDIKADRQILRKKLLKQRRKNALQNAKDRKMAKGHFLTALQASHKADRASKDTQSSRLSNDEMINGANADAMTQVYNIENNEIVVENGGDAATNAEDMNTDSTNEDNIDNAEIENEKSEEAVVMSDDKIENTAVSNNNTDDVTSGNDNAENVAKGEISTDDIPSPLLYGRKTTDPSKVKTSKKYRSIQVKPLESSINDPITDENHTKIGERSHI